LIHIIILIVLHNKVNEKMNRKINLSFCSEPIILLICKKASGSKIGFLSRTSRSTQNWFTTDDSEW